MIYLLFSFSQGQGTALYFLNLCCVAQLVMRIIMRNKIASIYDIFVLLICIGSHFLRLNAEFPALKIINLPGFRSLNSSGIIVKQACQRILIIFSWQEVTCLKAGRDVA